MKYIYLAFAVIALLSLSITYHWKSVNKAYEDGRIYERGQVDKAVIQEKVKQEKAVTTVEKEKTKIEIVYREKIKYVTQIIEDDFLDCTMSDDLFMHINSVRAGSDIGSIDETML